MLKDDNDDQEELARKRQLPVPPMPRKGGVLARSEDNVSGGALSLGHQHGDRDDDKGKTLYL